MGKSSKAKAPAVSSVMKKNPSLKDLVGSKLLTKAGGELESTDKLLAGKELILLYFSANWCPPCQIFSPRLIEFYKKSAEKGNFEVIYVSSDKTVTEFESYYGRMPWLAIPTDAAAAELKNKLSERLKISGIPTLVVLKADGTFVTDQSRQKIAAAHEDADRCLNVLQEWKDAESVPLEEAEFGRNDAGGLAQSGIMGFILMALKNPVYIFGAIYAIKWMLREYRTLWGNSEEEGEGAPDL